VQFLADNKIHNKRKTDENNFKNELRNVDRALEEYAKDNGRFGYEFEE
jgi:hypothetical protein